MAQLREADGAAPGTRKDGPAPTFRVGVVEDDGAWDRLVAASPQGNVFLRSDWLRMLCETSPDGLEVLRVGAVGPGGELRGGWAIPFRAQGGFRFSYGFDFFYCGPLLAPELSCGGVRRIAERQAVLGGLAREVAARADVVVAEAHPSFADARAFLYEGWQVAPEYTHLWDLGEPDRVLAEMNREKRREVRRALERVRVAREDDDDRTLGPFLELYRATMARFSWHPTPGWGEVLRRRFLWMRERDGCRLYAARSADGELLAAVLVLLSPQDGTAYLWRMGNHASARDAGVIPALYWAAGLDIAKGSPPLLRINFGGSPQAALGQFKDYLAATPTLHFRLIHRNESSRLRLWELGEKGKDRARRFVGSHPSLVRLAGLARRR